MKAKHLFNFFYLFTSIVFAQVNTEYHSVEGYKRSDGTVVPSHLRTNRNNTNSDNYTTKGNINPWNGKPGDIPSDGKDKDAINLPTPVSTGNYSTIQKYIPLELPKESYKQYTTEHLNEPSPNMSGYELYEIGTGANLFKSANKNQKISSKIYNVKASDVYKTNSNQTNELKYDVYKPELDNENIYFNSKNLIGKKIFYCLSIFFLIAILFFSKKFK